MAASEQWLSVADDFLAAGVGAGDWTNALAALAEASGSCGGQLIGFGSSRAAQFNWIADPDASWLEEYDYAGGTDPTINPRLAAGLHAPVMKLLTDADVVTPEARRKNPFYADYLARHDRPFICATNLTMHNEMSVGLAVLRTQKNGEIDPGQRALFAAIAPYARAAVCTQIALENQGAQLIAGALEAVSIAAFVCDRKSVVRAMTPAAEALVSSGDLLSLSHGQLRTTRPEHIGLLAEALRRAAGGVVVPGSPASSMVLLPCQDASPTVVDVISLPPRPYGFGFEPRTLVVVRTARDGTSRVPSLLQAVYRLTPAEAEVAVQLARGDSVEMIAAARGVAASTVRVQLRAIFGKLGVRRQSELVARVGQLG